MLTSNSTKMNCPMRTNVSKYIIIEVHFSEYAVFFSICVLVELYMIGLSHSSMLLYAFQANYVYLNGKKDISF